MSKYYKKTDLWTLFLISAFPLHVWTLLLAFRDISWLTERTNLWDAVGVLSYGLIYALFESVAIYVIILLLGFLITPFWSIKQRVTALGLSITMVSLVAIVGQLYYMQGWTLSDPLIAFLAQTGHPLRWLYGTAIAVILLVVVLPILLVFRSPRTITVWNEITDRISLLMTMYLPLDFAALCIVVYRNVQGAST
jgi:hypothetical protein